MIKNGKNYIPVPQDERDFKQLFKYMAAAGAGRPVDKNGVPMGSWTPELLAVEISKIENNSEGVDLRTVQMWFQDNTSGISTKNSQWLARVFGCGDRQAISEWQAELAAANRRLVANRRSNHRSKFTQSGNGQTVVKSNKSEHTAHETLAVKPINKFSLPQACDALFSGAILNVPSTIFAGAVALIFLSYFSGNHSFIRIAADGSSKQIGYLWAINWNMAFMLFFPAFFMLAASVLSFWKNEGRAIVSNELDQAKNLSEWTRSLEAASYTFWLVFVICIFFAGGVQWISVRLMPLLQGHAHYTTDWGSLALERPDVISVGQAIIFTGLAYLYMCICFFAMFCVLILLFTVAQDFWNAMQKTNEEYKTRHQHQIDKVIEKVVNGVYRCVVLGFLIVIVMKVQGSFMESKGVNVATWLYTDLTSVVAGNANLATVVGYSTPNHIASLLVALSVVCVFIFSAVRIPITSATFSSRLKLSGVMLLLILGYLTIGAFDGFSIILFTSIIIATYSLFDPHLGYRSSQVHGKTQSVQ